MVITKNMSKGRAPHPSLILVSVHWTGFSSATQMPYEYELNHTRCPTKVRILASHQPCISTPWVRIQVLYIPT